MFCKFLIVFGLLAAFSVQGMEATQLDARTVEHRGLTDLVDQVKDLIKNLTDFVSGDLGNALKTLTGFVDKIMAMKEKFLNKGLGAISHAFTKGVDFIGSKIEEADKLGINIVKCIGGVHEQLVKLAIGLSGELTTCVTKLVSDVHEIIKNDLKTIADITKKIVNLPIDLSKCLASLLPIPCVTKMVAMLTLDAATLPGQIKDMVEGVTGLVTGLPERLGECAKGISDTINSKVDATIAEVGKCVDGLKPKPTFRF